MPRVTPARSSSSSRVAPLRGQDRQAAQALDAAEAGGAPDHLSRSKKRAARVVAAADVDADHAAEAAHLLPRERVIRMRLEARVVDPRRRARSLRRASAATAIALALWRCDPDVPASSGRGRARRRRTDRGRRRAAGAPSRSAPSARAGPASAPAVTSLWPLRYFVALCMTRSTPSAIGCWLTGLAKVLSMTEITPRARQAARDRGDVHAAQRRVDRRLEPQQLRARRENTRSSVAQLVERREPRADAELRQQIREQVQRAAVDRRAADDFVAGPAAAPSSAVVVAAWPLESTQRASRRLRAPRSSARPPSTVGLP